MMPNAEAVDNTHNLDASERSDGDQRTIESVENKDQTQPTRTLQQTIGNAQLCRSLRMAERGSRGQPYLPPSVTRAIQQASGEPLPDANRGHMESVFGADLGGVRIHHDSDSGHAADDIGARAFTLGQDVYFGAGQYEPGTNRGNHLLAHELTHTLQQASGDITSQADTLISRPDDPLENEAETVADSVSDPRRSTKPTRHVAVHHLQRQTATDGGTTATDGGTASPVGKRTGRPIADLEREFRDLIKGARAKKYNVAADNLEHFLDGHGATFSVPLAWLRGFSEVTDAENKNHNRFEDQLKKQAKALADGTSATFSDHWDAALTASPLEELYYASGTSELSSVGSFTLTRTGNTISIAGTVNQRWHDPYNWNPGMSAFIPGYGSVSDNVGLDLKDAGRGQDYLLEDLYQQILTGTYTIKPWYLPDTSSFTWSGP